MAVNEIRRKFRIIYIEDRAAPVRGTHTVGVGFAAV
jgi:hypothetical protein